MDIGQKIKELRKKQGMSQKDLADKLGITPVMISQYENEKRNPKLETLQKISDALEVDISELSDSLNIKIAFLPNAKEDTMSSRLNEYWKRTANATGKDTINMTLAAHFDGDEYTPEELEEIRQFAEFVKSKRKKSDAE